MRGIDYKSLYEDLAIRVKAISVEAVYVEARHQSNLLSPKDLESLLKMIDKTATIARRDFREEEKLERTFRRRQKRYDRE